MKKIILLSLLCFTHLLIAGPLRIDSYDQVKGHQVASTAVLNEHVLTRVGTGVRQKNIMWFVNVDVYHTTLLVSDATRFVRDTSGTKALDSLQDMKARAFDIKFMRNVSIEKVIAGFESSLEKNKVRDSQSMNEFKAALQAGGDIKEGQTFSIAVDKNAGKLICKQGDLVSEIRGDDMFFRDLFSIWLGEPTDSELAVLREALIMGK